MFYRQSIILFGIVLPFVACAAVVGAGFAFKAKSAASFEEKKLLYKESEASRLGSQVIERQVSQTRPHFERWEKELEKETSTAITSHLKEIGDMLPPKEFQQTAFERPNGKGDLGTPNGQNSSSVKLAFRGTFRSVQRAFLELETRMPQLQLEELKIDPSNSSTSTLNFQVSYTAWEK